jgi:hypothetical protein
LRPPTGDASAKRLNILGAPGGSIAEEWVIFFRDSAGKDVEAAFTNREAALVQARGLMQQSYVVHKIEGPDEVLDREAIEEWVKANPE